MYDFNYRRPKSIDEAVSALTQASDGKLMSGGQTLLPTMKQRLASPSDVIDLGGISGMSGISESGGAVVIGAGTTHAEVAGNATVKSKIPALAAAAESIGDPQVRNKGTLGGSIANNDPAADYPAALLGLGASVKTSKRELAADDFFTGLFETALADDEIVLSVSFPVPEKAGYAKFPNPASRYAVVGVMVSKGAGGVRVAVTGAGQNGVFRAAAMESALGGNFSAEALAGISIPDSDLNADLHASAGYRAHLIGVMAKRAVEAAG